jgi:hypothetical protein
MTDVRLTALNPEDSKVYPVACNASGELLTNKSSDINLDVPGDITAGGQILNGGDLQSNTAAGCRIEDGVIYAQRPAGLNYDVFGGYSGTTRTSKIMADGSAEFQGSINVRRTNSNANTFYGQLNGVTTSNITAGGAASFEGDVVIGSRGLKWLIRESNGVAMLIEQTRRWVKEPRIEEVRDLPRELDLVEGALSEIMEKLKMTPPAGWPVWDGETETE